ncbi:ATP-binding cassette sub-family G member 1 [Tetrabaena socialis]|uniref:ATP-binding cassette sub-family G member 1 n=1 Tax=Tetrabaena socialis TaxID=47790 RepID=A0A2J7ZSB2_9CHLO|nr:ATP-binding cassette sub-family G member 1 [Tetrabaena socialis]|eukprot:PNH03162.1 ATP-binding cassette sub-family G member 1 [Tetrabaena socialis]
MASGRGALIEWRDLNFTVTDAATGQLKTILSDISGMAGPGRLLSIMGPSGAGKSTLLDVLAANVSSRGASTSGTITVDGAPRSDRRFRRISCYVQQKDVLLSSATVAVLSGRYWRSWIRNPIMMASELVQYVFTALFIGLMYCRFNDVLGEGDFNRASCIWFSFAVLCFTPSYTAVTNWSSERLLLKRELGQKLYGMTTFYLARYSVVIPFQIAQSLLFVSVVYFFVGFQASAGGFFTFFIVFAMFQIVSEGVGACCAVATRTATSAVILLTFVLLLLLAFSGFLTTKVPVYFVWVQKCSYLTYAFSALLERELSHITLRDPDSGELIPGMRTGLSYSQNIGVLAAQLAGMEALKLAVFNLAYRFDFM